ncbi:MAG: sugar phosphate isomerase/epimerase [Thermodesulfobacteriota bacterium]
MEETEPTPALSPEVLSRVHVCVPFRRLVGEFFEVTDKWKVNLELGLDAQSLDGFSREEFAGVAARLAERGARISLHAPFLDLSPGSTDGLILSATRKRLQGFVETAALFDPVMVVFHTGWDHRQHSFRREAWMNLAAGTLAELAEGLFSKTRAGLAVENVFERTPKVLMELCSRFSDPRIGFCLDVGHARVFSRTSLPDWIGALGDRVLEIHLHDNHGEDDDHLAPGRGSTDLMPLWEFLSARKRKPLVTLEAHTEKDVFEGLRFLASKIHCL